MAMIRPAGLTGAAAEAADEMAALADWAAAVRFADLPEATRRRAALVLADDLAAIVAARDEPELAGLQQQILARPAAAEATVFRGGRPLTDRISAALANGAAADWCELDEGYRRATCHAGLCTLPALLAEAEAAGLTTAELLTALTVGYELATRFARGFHFAGLVLHPHATLAAVGATAALAAARRLDAETLVVALGGAATMVAPGPFNHAVQGALVRNVWAGVGAEIGFRSVDWAPLGIGGHAASPYHVFVEGLGADYKPGQLTEDLGTDWAIEDGYHKLHACCQYSHSTVDAIAELHAAHPDLDPAQHIERILVETHWRGMTLDNPAPPTSLAAKFSMPHIAAAATLTGHAGAEMFTAASLDDPTLAVLRARVELKLFEPELPAPNDRPARVTWQLASGEAVTAECLSARGGPDRPFAPAEIMAKLATITGPVYPGFAAIAEDLIGLAPELLDRPWDAVVARFAGDAAG